MSCGHDKHNYLCWMVIETRLKTWAKIFGCYLIYPGLGKQTLYIYLILFLNRHCQFFIFTRNRQIRELQMKLQQMHLPLKNNKYDQLPRHWVRCVTTLSGKHRAAAWDSGVSMWVTAGCQGTEFPWFPRTAESLGMTFASLLSSHASLRLVSVWQEGETEKSISMAQEKQKITPMSPSPKLAAFLSCPRNYYLFQIAVSNLERASYKDAQVYCFFSLQAQ